MLTLGKGRCIISRSLPLRSTIPPIPSSLSAWKEGFESPLTDHTILSDFHPAVREWFLRTYGEATPPQTLGWPSIASGRNTLILAPTGSGKTLAAFLWAINHLFDQSTNENVAPGVRILYVSPLKALNNDIERNLRAPLKGIRDEAGRLGIPCSPIRAAVRTGDTPQSQRAAMITHPPDILITTPESLYLMLTSSRPRGIFRTVQYVIVDEIHSVCGNKRGVHLSLSLERLQEIADQEFVRIGLSATQKPLETVAAFLGGQEWEGSGAQRTLRPRPVSIIDAGRRKEMDVRVSCPVADFSLLGDKGAWPAIYEELQKYIRTHATTLIFVNNRRLAERIAARLNEMAFERRGEDRSGMINLSAVPVRTEGLPDAARRRTAKASSETPESTDPILVQAYHGSMSRQAREEMERALKAGELRALVATSSLELGIDIGSIDLVVQIQSPKGVARGLQRVGRSGHLVNAASKGRILPTHREDLVEAAVVARGMMDHDVEPTSVPENCLDVLAQQIVAMTAVEEWPADALYDVIRRSYCYRDLPRAQFDNVLGMLAGRYTAETFRELRARISWDKVNNVLRALPGTAHLAITSGGTIADRGYFGVYLEDAKTRVGEVDEEFVYESRAGDTFILGSSVWRISFIDANRVTVTPAPGQPARMPFWRGEGIGRTCILGEKVGQFRRMLMERLDDPGCLAWLRREFPVDDNAAWNILEYFRRQRDATSVVPHDRLLLVEGFRDEIGDPRIVVHSVFGRSVNGLLGLLLARRLREMTGVEAQMLYNDDGVLLRTSDRENLPLDLLRGVTAGEARSVILEELISSPLFAGQFRQNAARALLMPRIAPGKRTPLWLQRMRASDLLEIARRFEDFPIVLETMRDILNDVLDLRRFTSLMHDVETGAIAVTTAFSETPSPFAASLLFEFIAVYMYAYDRPRAGSPAQAGISPEGLSDIIPAETLAGFLKPEAIDAVEGRLQHEVPGSQARSAEELMQIILLLGDLSSEEVSARSAGDSAAMLGALEAQGRITRMEFPGGERWIAVEDEDLYANLADESNARVVIGRFLQNHGPVPRTALIRRYGLHPDRLRSLEAAWSADRQLIRGRFRPSSTDGGDDEWCYRPNIERIHRQTIAILRKEITPVSLRDFTLFLQEWTMLAPRRRMRGETGVETVLEQFQGLPLPADAWERDILRSRIVTPPVEAPFGETPSGDVPSRDAPSVEAPFGDNLAELTRGGSVVWAGSGAGRMKPFARGNGHLFPVQGQEEPSPAGRRILEFLKDRGASFFTDIRHGTSLSLDAINTGIAGLFWGGHVSNDAFNELTALKRSVRESDGPIDRVQIVDPRHNPRRSGMMAQVRRALRQVPGWSGRWFLLETPGVCGEPVTDEERAAFQARQLLDRYGLVAREFLPREEMLPWAMLAGALQHMELRGEIRRGYFIEGFSGMQFALPEAADNLRRLHERPAGRQGVLLAASCDPANPYGSGINLPGAPGTEPARVSRNGGHYIAFADGSPLLVFESLGARVRTAGSADPSLIEEALRQFVALMRLPDRLRPFSEAIIEYWDELRPAESEHAGMLRRLGFQGDRNQTMRIDLYTS